MPLKKKGIAVLDESDDERNANERDIEEVRKATRAEREPKEREPKEERPIEVDLDEEEDDEEDDEEKDERPATRDEKKRNRSREHAAARERAETALTEERAARQRTDEENRFFRAQLTERLSRDAQPKQDDPHDAKLKNNRERQDALLTEYNGRLQQLKAGERLSGEEEAKYRERMRALNQEEMETVIDKRTRAGGGQQVTPQSVEQQVVLNTFAQRYPDMVKSQATMRVVQAEEQALIATGEPKNWATIDKAVKNTRKRLGLRSDTPDVRQRFAGTRSAGGGGGETVSGKVNVTKADLKMARAAWPALSDEKRIKKIAKMKRDAAADAQND